MRLTSNIDIADERHRAGKDLYPDVVASITLTSLNGDESWGEFLTYSELNRLITWADKLLDTRN